MNKIVRPLLSIALTLSCAVALALQAVDNSDPEQLVRDTVSALKAALNADRARIEQDPEQAMEIVQKIVEPNIDTQLASRLILGKHWRRATPEQRSAFIDGFRALLLRTYAIHATDYLNVEIDYHAAVNLSEEGKRKMVRTDVTRPGKPSAQVGYRMAQGSDGWRVFDVVVNGISVVVTFRSAIDAEIAQHGIDGAIARLREKALATPQPAL